LRAPLRTVVSCPIETHLKGLVCAHRGRSPPRHVPSGPPVPSFSFLRRSPIYTRLFNGFPLVSANSPQFTVSNSRGLSGSPFVLTLSVMGPCKDDLIQRFVLVIGGSGFFPLSFSHNNGLHLFALGAHVPHPLGARSLLNSQRRSCDVFTARSPLFWPEFYAHRPPSQHSRSPLWRTRLRGSTAARFLRRKKGPGTWVGPFFDAAFLSAVQ